MDFRTELTLKPSTRPIGLTDPVLTLGSCFAQSIGQQFSDAKFKTLVNPLGTIYHPFSIHKLLHYVVYQEYPPVHTYLASNDMYYNYDLHSSYRHVQLADLRRQLQERIAFVHHFLSDCKVLLITWGTAWIYERNDNGEAVANCHKMPAMLFTKRLASVEEIMTSFDIMFKALTSFNPGIRIVLTLSPVRHLKDTLELNHVSKSTLRLAAHQISNSYLPVDYFPSYEIMLDDLRDYRFYKNDLIHPTKTAEEYIWEKFSNVYFDSATRQLLSKWNEIRKALSHKPFYAEGNPYQQFLRETLTRVEEIQSEIDVEQELQQLRSQLSGLQHDRTR